MEYASVKLQTNPFENANFLSKLIFGWTIPIFKRSLRTHGKILDAGDACKPITNDQSRILGERLHKYCL